VRLGQQADLVVVAPATAHLLARAAHGLADDLLTNTLLTARCPVVLAPAMHTEMWEHPATAPTSRPCVSRGVHGDRPGLGRLDRADTGQGRLPEPEDIFAVCRELLSAAAGSSRGTAGRTARRWLPDWAAVVVSAGRHPRAAGPGARSWATAPRASRDMRWLRWHSPVRKRSPWSRRTWSCLSPEGARLVPVQTALELGEAVGQDGAGVRRRRDGRCCGGLPAGALRRRQDQEISRSLRRRRDTDDPGA
jgi:phosphopantothenoylcysteine decarboxylase/phosphopantothenate--cysteine ligase